MIDGITPILELIFYDTQYGLITRQILVFSVILKLILCAEGI
jgi:hypothetical protein